ncbi:MAG TPA: SH3 domain-containing C40 family peptidase, partial [Longimicrobium sp.]|nr:SH3 domain-containing C40 family peptidase [Longimicrobium sp.]
AAEEFAAVVQEIRDRLAPDPRLAVFDVTVEVRDGETLALVGATSERDALQEMHQRVAQLTGWGAVVDEVQLLPEAAPDEMVHAVVSAAVAPMLAGARIAETQVSQVVLGNRLVVLRRSGRWLQCRSPEGYIGWIHAGYVALMGETDARGWDAGDEGDVWISLGSEVRTEEHEVLARLPWGARVVREGEHAVRLPDGRVGRPHGEIFPAVARPLAFPAEGAAVCESASRWLGVPYLWGGVTMGGVDCSGFVQAVYRMHGVTIPRDSDQQSRAGAEVIPDDDFGNLLPGDLLFFTEERGKITHVTMSTGGSRIIHSSLGNGGVARNDVAGRRNYERELRRLFVCARRMIV